VLGLPDKGKKGDSASTAQKEHESYMQLLQECVDTTQNGQVKAILDFLQHCSPYIPDAKPGDLCAFQVEQQPWPHDDEMVRIFWSEYVERRLAEDKQQCVICCHTKPITRILPFKVTLIKGTDPVQLVSFNLESFQSLGKIAIEYDELVGNNKIRRRKAGANAAICYPCACTIGQVLQYLVKLDKDNDGHESSSGHHAVVLARDDSKGKGKQPMKNEIAVFWTREPVNVQPKGTALTSFEDIAKIPIEEFDEDALPARAGQCRALLEAPFGWGRQAPTLPSNRFYLAVLSPNITRLVVRDWLETDIEPVYGNISRYIQSLQIVHPERCDVWWPPLSKMLGALQSYTSAKHERNENPRIAALGPDVMRKLIRCIYTGTVPPVVLLARAVRCFRVPNPPTDDTPQGREQRERQMSRLMSIAAAMKLILTYDKGGKEQKAMEKLKTEHDDVSEYKHKAPYNCGVLLAIMEAAQRRAIGVNTTIVERFYGVASTAPASVFGYLINTATKAHLAKLRRDGKELFSVLSQEDPVNINELMNAACKAVDEAGGFPGPLKPEEQAQFALGFYHQRAEFKKTAKK
jgi:CRISPR-associated protein Csd1